MDSGWAAKGRAKDGGAALDGSKGSCIFYIASLGMTLCHCFEKLGARGAKESKLA